MKIAILGYDIEGRSNYEYFASKGDSVLICDKDPDKAIPKGANASLGDDYLDNLHDYDLLVRTAGMQPSVILEKYPNAVEKIWSSTNEFFKACPTKNIIGVTGTKGKGTTASLIAQMLTNSNKTVHLGGNIGIAPLSFINDIKPEDWVVLEISSFQSIDLKSSPHIGVCLMIVPEHLDWHTNLQEYYSSKKNLFNNQKATDFVIYNSQNFNSYEVVKSSPANQITYDVPHYPINISKHQAGAHYDKGGLYYGQDLICYKEDVALHGHHNLENVCAAIAAVKQIDGVSNDSIVKTIKNFKGLEHRLEFVDEVDGIAFFNDSFATTPEATIAAIKAIEKPKVLILGGSDKGISLVPVIEEVLQSNVRHVIAIGTTGKTMAQGLRRHHYPHITEGLTTMEEIVGVARDKAKKGDAVLLSTASASFDMFDNYKDRGNQFKKAVQNL